jgi:hypothetical protein
MNRYGLFCLLFLLTFSNETIAQTTRLIVPADVGIQVPFGAVGNVLVAGPATSQIQDSAAATSVSMPVGVVFSNNAVLASPFTTAQGWLNINGKSLSGTAGTPGDGNISPFRIYIGGDTVDTTTSGNGVLDTLAVTHAASAGHTGFRTAIQGSENVVGTPASGGPNYVGVLGITRGSANLNGTTGAYTNYAGGIFGMNANAYLTSGATFITSLVGFEADVTLQIGSSVAEKHGITIILGAADVGRATYDDSALEFDNQEGTSTTWKYGISFGSYGHKWAFGTDSTLIGAQQRQAPSTDSPIALNGVDFTAVAFQSGGCAFKSSGFCITPSGGVQVSGTTAPANGMYLATAGVVSIAANSTGTVLNVGTGWVGLNQTSPINSNDKFMVHSGAAAIASSTFRDNSNSASAGFALFLANDTSNIQVSMQLNSSTNVSGNGANSFTINSGQGIWFAGGGTVGLRISNTGVPILPGVVTGTPVASLCLDASNNIIKKTTTGSCI